MMGEGLQDLTEWVILELRLLSIYYLILEITIKLYLKLFNNFHRTLSVSPNHWRMVKSINCRVDTWRFQPGIQDCLYLDKLLNPCKLHFLDLYNNNNKNLAYLIGILWLNEIIHVKSLAQLLLHGRYYGRKAN